MLLTRPARGGIGMSSWKSIENQKFGYQRHHLIPVNVIHSHAFAKLFALISGAGFNPHCFSNNGFSLPSTEIEAARTGLPLHRGPHRQYDDLIAQCLNVIWLAVLTGHIPANPVSIMIHVSDLQGRVRRNLGPNAWIKLNQHDPRDVEDHLYSLDDSLKQLNQALLLS
jgi:hypothetical protein